MQAFSCKSIIHANSLCYIKLQILFQAESQIVSNFFSKQHRQLICTNMKTLGFKNRHWS